MTYDNPVRNFDSSEFEVNKKVIFQFVLDKLSPLMDGPFPLDEMMLMAAAAIRFNPKLILEWGTNVGYSAKIFYETVKAFSLRSEIHSIDLPDDATHVEHNPEKVGILIRDIDEIKLHRGDGVNIALDLAKDYPDANVLFFVDGDHEYESVKRELIAITEKVKYPIIIIHDTLNQSSNSLYNIGPYLATKEILSSREHQWIWKTMGLGLPGMILCYKQESLSIK